MNQHSSVMSAPLLKVQIASQRVKTSRGFRGFEFAFEPPKGVGLPCGVKCWLRVFGLRRVVRWGVVTNGIVLSYRWSVTCLASSFSSHPFVASLSENHTTVQPALPTRSRITWLEFFNVRLYSPHLPENMFYSVDTQTG
jgi:hypothetical protein